jgi:hypothetical protein
MTKTRKVLRTLVALGVVGGIATVGAFSAFSSQTDNPGNTVTAGTVVLADNDAGAALYTMPNAKPGDQVQSCIRVSYTGSLGADVKLYTPSTIGALGQYVNLQIEPGTQPSPSFPSCTGFVPDSGGPLFNNTLNTFPTTYASGVSDYPGAGTSWVNGNSVVYRVTATLSGSAPDAAQSLTTGSHTIRWEARNQ